MASLGTWPLRQCGKEAHTQRFVGGALWPTGAPALDQLLTVNQLHIA